jgi:predicted nucleic acid-binding protein
LIVLDASLALAWLLGEAGSPVPLPLRESFPDVPFMVPSHWPVEIANALRSEFRNRELPVSDLEVLLDQLDELDVRVAPPIGVDDIGPLSQFAFACNLTAYDAAYVQLALQTRTILATLDGAMRQAATHLNIPLLPT